MKIVEKPKERQENQNARKRLYENEAIAIAEAKKWYYRGEAWVRANQMSTGSIYAWLNAGHNLLWNDNDVRKNEMNTALIRTFHNYKVIPFPFSDEWKFR